MRLEDYQQKPMADFPGLWSRGTSDQVPQDHFSVAQNLRYSQGEVSTRPGLTKAISPGYGGPVRRFQNFFNPMGIITLILDNSGNLYTSSSRVGDSATTPLINIPGALDFIAIQMFNRIYITFSDGTKGLAGVNLKVYIPGSTPGADIIRDAGGAAPTAASAIVAAPSATAGLLTQGQYQIAVSFITNTGYLTQPGPLISSVYSPTIYNAPPGYSAFANYSSDGTNFSNGDTTTIGGITYTWKTALTNNGQTPGEILIEASLTLSLQNAANSLNGAGNPGVDYGIGSTNIGVTAVYNPGATFITVTFATPGTSGNSITVSTSSVHTTWKNAVGGAVTTLTGGTNGFKVSLTNIPTGPAGTVSRQLFMTQANELELFFIPSTDGGIINDNVTTIATIDVDQVNDLIESADYLFNILTAIPTGINLAEYHGRLLTCGEETNQSIIRASNAGDPETFTEPDDIIAISIDDGFTMTNMAIVRDTGYAHKTLGVFVFQDNADIPANWPVYPIDKAINTPVHGISELFGLAGIKSTRDMYFAVDRSGLVIFNGTFVKPPLTYKVNSLWQQLNFAHYEKVNLVMDEQNHIIYCAFPIGSSVENNAMIVGDYSLCGPFNPYTVQQELMKIKWSTEVYEPDGSAIRPTCIALIAVPGDKVPTIKVGSLDGNYIWKLDPTVELDDGSPIISLISTALLFWQAGFVHSFNAIRLRIEGSGNLQIIANGEDDVLITNLFATAALNNLGFFGIGLNDLSISGTFSDAQNDDFIVKIDSTGVTDTFQWSQDGGETFISLISITGTAQLLAWGVSITFAATTGHTLGDTWRFKGFNNPIVLGSSPGKEVLARFNFRNEKASILFKLSSGSMTISSIIIYGYPEMQMRPL